MPKRSLRMTNQISNAWVLRGSPTLSPKKPNVNTAGYNSSEITTSVARQCVRALLEYC